MDRRVRKVGQDVTVTPETMELMGGPEPRVSMVCRAETEGREPRVWTVCRVAMVTLAERENVVSPAQQVHLEPKV